MSAAGRAVVAALRLDQWSRGEVDAAVDEALALDIGGFIIFGGEAERVGELTEAVRERAARGLWFAADLERGAGQQFRGLAELPPPAALARHPDPAAATAFAATRTAHDALSVGVNWVFAPVLDIDAEPDNPIVATRSFHADPAVVSELGAVWIAACQETGALACAKHFPGHGRTLGDSHVELPVVEATRDELSNDLAPFRAVASDVGSIMVAHVAFPALGSDRPATVSPEIVDGLLRKDLGFDGLVATDAMIMSGIGEDDASAAVSAIRAGCDIILYPGDVARTVAALERAADQDEDVARRVALAGRRSADALARIARVAGGVSGSATDLAVESIVDRSGGLTGWDPSAATDVVAVSDDPEIGPPAGREGPLGTIVEARLADLGWNIVKEGARQRVAVLAATPRGWKGHGRVSDRATDEVTSALANHDRSLLVLLGHERWLDQLGLPGICAWSTESSMEHAAALWLDREARATSRPDGVAE